MHLLIYLPLLVCIAGAFVYAITANPKVAELARGAFWDGLLVTLFEFAGKIFRL